jgi:hypothetical protein
MMHEHTALGACAVVSAAVEGRYCPLRGMPCPSLCCLARHAAVITETNRVHLVLFGMQNRTSGPYLAAINRMHVSLMCVLAACSTDNVGNAGEPNHHVSRVVAYVKQAWPYWNATNGRCGYMAC